MKEKAQDEGGAGAVNMNGDSNLESNTKASNKGLCIYTSIIMYSQQQALAGKGVDTQRQKRDWWDQYL